MPMSVAISRRGLLAGAGASALLAACGGGGSNVSNGTGPAASTGSSASTSGAALPAYNLIGFYAADALRAGSPQRLTVGIADAEGVLLRKKLATELVFDVAFEGRPTGTKVTATAHDAGIPRAYYPIVFTPEKAGNYTLSTNLGGTPLETSVSIGTATAVPGPGQKMIPFNTPTTASHAGVEFLCSRDPACPLHDLTLTQALAANKPVVFLIATPRFCQTAICGPVLDVLLEVRRSFPDILFVHSEVYPSTAAAGTGDTLPVVGAYHLTFEPVAFLANARGDIQHRLDTVFDRVELSDAIKGLGG